MAIHLTKNADAYGISFHAHGSFSLSYGGIGKNVIIFGTDMISSGYIDNKKKDISILGEAPTQNLNNIMLTA